MTNGSTPFTYGIHFIAGTFERQMEMSKNQNNICIASEE